MSEINNLKPVQKLRPFTHFCMSIGNLPSSYLESMTYYEQIVWFIKFLEDTVIPTINNNGEAVEELQQNVVNFENSMIQRQDAYELNITTLYNQLKSYVDNYFDNLDVQEEINNKLDDMVEAGTLQEIITSYLNSKALFCFDNVQGMKEATNLIDGSFSETLGFYSKNDGGKATYKIRNKVNEDVIDEKFIVSVLNENLVAELIIKDFVNAKQLGAYGDNIHDDSSILQAGINFCENSSIFKQFFIPKGTYYLSTPIKTKTFVVEHGDGMSGDGITIKGENGTILTRNHNDITPPTSANSDFGNCCLALCSNNNIIDTLKFMHSKVGLYIGQDPADLTEKTNAHFNKIYNTYYNGCGIAIDFVAGYGNYYTNIDNFKIYYGNIGIDFKKYSNTAGVSNRGNFSNGEINKCFAGVHVTSPCDTNIFSEIHCEQLTSGFGVGTPPEWLPNNKGVAWHMAGSSNIVSKCVCESCQVDLYDEGYDNRYLFDVFTISKIDMTNTRFLGTSLIGTPSSNQYLNKIGGMVQQSESILQNVTTWVSQFDGDLVSNKNLYDKGFNQSMSNLSTKIDTTNFTVSQYIGGTSASSSDNVFYHKRIGKMNFLYIKGCILVDQASSNSDLKINLPSVIIDKFSSFANRKRMRFPVIVHNEIVFAYIYNQQLVIPAPSGRLEISRPNSSFKY